MVQVDKDVDNCFDINTKITNPPLTLSKVQPALQPIQVDLKIDDLHVVLTFPFQPTAHRF